LFLRDFRRNQPDVVIRGVGETGVGNPNIIAKIAKIIIGGQVRSQNLTTRTRNFTARKTNRLCIEQLEYRLAPPFSLRPMGIA
jgi:hypothetical protein